MDIVVIDVETKNTFQEIGSNNPADLEISFVGLYTTLNHHYLYFYENEISKVWEVIKNVDRIVGFNIKRFDLPLLRKYAPQKAVDPLPGDIIDIYEDVYAVTRQERISLDRLAIPTLNMKKTGHGLDASRFYKNGDLERLKEYCLQDVRITWELYRFGLKNKYLLLLQKNGSIMQIPVNWHLKKIHE